MENNTNIMNFLSINDIIAIDKIDLLIKQIEESSMKDKNKWEVPKYTKSEINKAGKIIADSSSTPKEREEALIILNNWRLHMLTHYKLFVAIFAKRIQMPLLFKD